MKMQTLINMLTQLQGSVPDSFEVLAWDADAGDYAPVTGYMVDSVSGTVELQTDDNE